MKPGIAVLGAALAMTGPAVAEGAAFPTPLAAAAPFSWTGFYVGLQAGYGWGGSRWVGPLGPLAVDQSGGAFGVEAGYNVQFAPNWVGGLEASAAWANIGGDTPCPLAGFACRAKADFVGDVALRGGFAIDRALLFVKGGAAFVNQNFGDANPALPALNATTGWPTAVGFVVGGGVEYALADHVSAKIEYDYIGLGSRSYDLVDPGVYDDRISVRQTYQIVKAGLNYKF